MGGSQNQRLLTELPPPRWMTTHFTLYVLLHEIGHAIVGGYRGWFARITWRYGFPHPWIGVYVAQDTIITSLAGWTLGLIVVGYLWLAHNNKYALLFLALVTIASTGDIIDAIQHLPGATPIT